MIPTKTNDINVVSKMGGEVQGKFSVDAASMAHIMSVLTDLYSDAEGAVIREYITNAWDSHVEAGQTRPVEVNTPGKFTGNFVIKDYGIGMSVDDIINTYAKYGASTKRESNELVGMLGLGSKSAMTYTNSFVVIAIKNGVKAHVLISKDDKGVPEYNVVDTCKTSEPNGVEIRIPAKADNNFDEKTKFFLRFWPKGTVLMNGNEPETHNMKSVGEGQWIDVSPRNWNNRNESSFLVMGNVPYPVKDVYTADVIRNSGFKFVIEVPIGSVDITPNREELQYTDKTVAVIKEASRNIFSKYVTTVHTEMNTFTEPWDLLKFYQKLPHVLKREKLIHDFIAPKTNDMIGTVENLQVPACKNGQHNYIWKYDHNYTRGNLSEGYHIHITSVPENAMLVTGVTEKPNALIKKKARFHAEANGLNPTYIWFITEDFQSVWIENMTRVPLDDIKSLKIPRKSSTKPRIKELPFWYYKVKDGEVFSEEAVTIKGKKVAYVSNAELRTTQTVYYAKDADPRKFLKLMPDWKLAVITKGQFDRFVRLNPGAVHLDEALKSVVNDAASKTGTEYDFTNHYYDEVQGFYDSVDVSRIDDPNLVAEVEKYRESKTNKTYVKYRQRLDALTEAFKYAKIDVPSVASSSIKPRAWEQYPLISSVGINEELIFYINAKWRHNSAITHRN